MGNIAIWFAGISLLLTFTVLLGQALYRTGHLSARVEELERWRIGIRTDLHEISDRMELMALEVRGVRTLIEERTERRRFDRDDKT